MGKLISSGIGMALSGGLLTLGLQAQNSTEDFEKVMRYFAETPSYEVKVNVTVYERNASTTLLSSADYYLKKGGDNLLCDMNGVRIITNERCALTIRENQKYLHFAERDREAKSTGEVKPVFAMQDGLKLAESVEFKSSEGDEKVYLLRYKQNMINEVYVHIGASTGRLNKLRYFQAPNNELGITYEIVITYMQWKETDFARSEFSEDKYVKKVRDGYEVTDAYAGYLLIVDNHTNQ